MPIASAARNGLKVLILRKLAGRTRRRFQEVTSTVSAWILTSAAASCSVSSMPQATLRFNPDESLIEAILPDGQEYGPASCDEDLVVFSDVDEPLNAYLAVLSDDYEGLTRNTLYHLVPVTTVVEANVDMDETDDSDDDAEAIDDEPTGEPV